jgi:hypothetical protein
MGDVWVDRGVLCDWDICAVVNGVWIDGGWWRFYWKLDFSL